MRPAERSYLVYRVVLEVYHCSVYCFFATATHVSVVFVHKK